MMSAVKTLPLVIALAGAVVLTGCGGSCYRRGVAFPTRENSFVGVSCAYEWSKGPSGLAVAV
jgi:hypothetical protein